jgi:excisionase family DNA binding protein
MEQLRSLADAARALGIAPDTLRAQVHRGRLQAQKVGRDWLVTSDEIERYRRESLLSNRPANKHG